MGTLLAMAYVQRYPERVRGVVLTGAVPPRAPTAADSARDAADAAAAQAFRTRPAVQAELRRAGLDGDPAVLAPKQQTEAWRIRFAATNLHHVERWRALKGGQVFYNARAGRAAGQTVPRDYDYTPALLGHACSVTVIIGDHDFVDWGGVRHQAWTRGAPNATVVVLRDAGHNAWLDAPDPFRDALEAALARSAQCPAP
jgi:pimeloyl-ACP methyl ester carboxylesterase